MESIAIQIDNTLRLRRFDGNYDFAFEWYQDPETAPQEADEHREHVGSDAVMKTFQAKPNAYLASLIFFRGSASPAAPGSLRDCYPRGV